MAKINKKQKRAVKVQAYTEQYAQHPDATLNHEGGLAFNYADQKMELFTLVMSCMFNEPKFYGKIGDTELRIKTLISSIGKSDPTFLLHLAKFVRHEGNLRSVPIVMLVEIANVIKAQTEAQIKALTLSYKNEKGMSEKEAKVLARKEVLTARQKDNNVRSFVPQILGRADEITEALGYQSTVFGDVDKMPMSLKRGLVDSFKNFTAYQLLKYDREGAISLKDAINILHPTVPLKGLSDADSQLIYRHIRGWDFQKDKDAEVLNKIDTKQAILTKKTIDAEVLALVEKGTITWEVFISHFGSTTESWTAIAPHMPYMATLRNLRNFIEKGVPTDVLKKVAERLTNEQAVLKSRQFPFRFHSAMKALTECTTRVPSFLVTAISDALEISVKNLPKLGGVTAVFSDNSGSMHTPISNKSTVENIDIASMMSAIAQYFSDDAVVGVFGTYFKFVPMNPKDSVLTNMEKIKRTNVEHSTNAYLSIEALTKGKVKVDRIFIFSDMQCYDSGNRGWGGSSLAGLLKDYRKTINPNVKMYSFDIAGHGTAQFPSDDKNVVTLGGFSEKIFKFMEIFESTSDNTILDVIANY